jgi:predicted ATPase with chaperone activity
MLAKRITSILPPLSFEEALECTKIHSISGLLPANSGLITAHPVRAPHHSVPDPGLMGGSSILHWERSVGLPRGNNTGSLISPPVAERYLAHLHREG